MNNNYCTSYTGGRIGNFGNESSAEVERKHTIVQSLWTKPITDYKRLRETLFLAALSLEYAHRSGYKVNMHTDSLGVRLLSNFGYDKLCSTLASIPSSVPVQPIIKRELQRLNPELYMKVIRNFAFIE